MAAFWASKNNWKNCFQSQCYSFRQSFNEIESNDSDLKLFSYYRCVFCISSESETSKTDDSDVNFVVWEKIDELIDSGIYSFILRITRSHRFHSIFDRPVLLLLCKQAAMCYGVFCSVLVLFKLCDAYSFMNSELTVVNQSTKSNIHCVVFFFKINRFFQNQGSWFQVIQCLLANGF